MSGAKNAIVGDQDLPTALPETVVPESVLTLEKSMAKYSKSAEFKRLKEFMEARIEFYQRYFPSGQRVQDIPEGERAVYWQAACIVVSEFENILADYAQARAAVEDNGRSKED